MHIVPSDIRAETSSGRLCVVWSDGATSEYPFAYLRGECRCAACVDEITGRRILDVANIPGDIHIERMELRGKYAVRIAWSDGHDTGLYTWEFLRGLADFLESRP